MLNDFPENGQGGSVNPLPFTSEDRASYWQREAIRERKRAEALYNDKCTLLSRVEELEKKLAASMPDKRTN